MPAKIMPLIHVLLWRRGAPRRQARRVSCQEISPRLGSTDNLGKFMLIEPHRNVVIAGERFELDAEHVVAFCYKQP
jgi:hypothetical protein